MNLPIPLEEPMLKGRKPPSIVEDQLRETSQELNAIPPQIPVTPLQSPDVSFLYGFCADRAAKLRNIQENISVLGRILDETTVEDLILVDAEQVRYQNFQDNLPKALLVVVKPSADLVFDPANRDFILFPSSSKASLHEIRARIDGSSQCAASRLHRSPAESALSSVVPTEADAPGRPDAVPPTINRALGDFHGIGTWMEVLVANFLDTNENTDFDDNLASLGEGPIP